MAECSVWGVFYYCGRVLCLGGVLLVWQSALSDWFYTSVAECSVWGVFYYCGRVLCLGGVLLLWQSTLSDWFYTSVAECSVLGVFYYCGRVVCPTGLLTQPSPSLKCKSQKNSLILIFLRVYLSRSLKARSDFLFLDGFVLRNSLILMVPSLSVSL